MPTETLRRLILPPGAFRLVLAVAVVISHVSRLDIGRLAVLLFFFLSGYWVSRIWVGEFSGKRWQSFYLSRWLRIVPLYLIVLVAAAGLRHLPIGPENVLLFGVNSTHHDPIGVAWSLDVELQFYLLLPLLFLATPALVIPGVAALSFAGWALGLTTDVNTVLMYLPVFAAGMVTARTRWTPGPRTAVSSLGAFTLLTVAIATVPYFAPFMDKRLTPPFDHDLFGMLWMAPLLPYVAASLAVKSSHLDRDIGNWSYPLYLVHVPLIAVCTSFALSKWLGVAAAFPLALALFYGPDKIFEAYRRRLINSRPSQPPEAAQGALAS